MAKDNSGRNFITLQLTVPALEKLIEIGGQEVVLSLRQAVIEEYARRHVRQAFSDAEKNHLNDVVRAEIGLAYGDSTKGATLSKKFHESIRAEMTKIASQAAENYRSSASSMFHAATREIEKGIDAKIKDRVDYLTDAYIEGEVKRRIEARMKAIINSAVKERAGD